MSREDLQSLIEKMKADPEFKKHILDLGDVDKRLEYISKAGFNITAMDLKALLQEASDNELEQIAGGSEGRCMGHSCWW